MHVYPFFDNIFLFRQKTFLYFYERFAEAVIQVGDFSLCVPFTDLLISILKQKDVFVNNKISELREVCIPGQTFPQTCHQIFRHFTFSNQLG